MCAMKGKENIMKESSHHQQGFISTIFLIVMCLMISLIALKSDYILKADQVYANLEEYQEIFEAEAEVIDVFKCLLARNEEINDFCTDGICVSVFQNGNDYELFFLDYEMSVSVYEKQIIDFRVRHD